MLCLAHGKLDFRWDMGLSDTEWYPGVVLERQPCPREWQTPLAAVSTRIARPVGGSLS